jgi:hypothetical protein
MTDYRCEMWNRVGETPSYADEISGCPDEIPGYAGEIPSYADEIPNWPRDPSRGVRPGVRADGRLSGSDPIRLEGVVQRVIRQKIS